MKSAAERRTECPDLLQAGEALRRVQHFLGWQSPFPSGRVVAQATLSGKARTTAAVRLETFNLA